MTKITDEDKAKLRAYVEGYKENPSPQSLKDWHLFYNELLMKSMPDGADTQKGLILGVQQFQKLMHNQETTTLDVVDILWKLFPITIKFMMAVEPETKGEGIGWITENFIQAEEIRGKIQSNPILKHLEAAGFGPATVIEVGGPEDFRAKLEELFATGGVSVLTDPDEPKPDTTPADTTYEILHVNGTRENVTLTLPKEPGYDALKQIIMPILRTQGTENFEHVNVLFNDKHCDMFVDDMGTLKKLPRNNVATDIYRAATLKRYPKVDPESIDPIHGTAVLFHRRVWY